MKNKIIIIISIILISNISIFGKIKAGFDIKNVKKIIPSSPKQKYNIILITYSRNIKFNTPFSPEEKSKIKESFELSQLLEENSNNKNIYLHNWFKNEFGDQFNILQSSNKLSEQITDKEIIFNAYDEKNHSQLISDSFPIVICYVEKTTINQNTTFYKSIGIYLIKQFPTLLNNNVFTFMNSKYHCKTFIHLLNFENEKLLFRYKDIKKILLKNNNIDLFYNSRNTTFYNKFNKSFTKKAIVEDKINIRNIGKRKIKWKNENKIYLIQY